MDVTLLASVGRMEFELGLLPTNCTARPHIPQQLVLSHARAVVGGGHSSIVLGALTHGLPGLFVPKGGETPANARRMALAGAGIWLGADEVSVSTMSAHLERVLTDETLWSNARALGSRFAAERPILAAASAIERLLGQAHDDEVTDVELPATVG